MSDFFLNKTDKSGREGLIVYMGNDIFGVKWRNWKLHAKEQEARSTLKNTYTMPRIYNLYDNPRKRNNVVFPHTCVPKAALKQFEEHLISLQLNPPIPAGQKDPYEPKLETKII